MELVASAEDPWRIRSLVPVLGTGHTWLVAWGGGCDCPGSCFVLMGLNPCSQSRVLVLEPRTGSSCHWEADVDLNGETCSGPVFIDMQS